MRPRLIVLGLLVVALAGTQAAASYYPASFGDTRTNWPGYSIKSSQDQIGIPIFPGTPSTLSTDNNKAGVVTLDETNNQLLSITINYEGGNLYSSVWSKLKPGDLFLDTDALDTNGDSVLDTNVGWDYVVCWTGSYADSDHDGILTEGLWSIYAFDTDIPLANTGQYSLVSTSSWPGSEVRAGHPWALSDCWLQEQLTAGKDGKITAEELTGGVDCSGWKILSNSAKTGSITFDFTTLADALCVDSLTIGFTVNCANDVIYETITLKTPTGEVPEPASLLVWSILGLSFAGGSWRLAFRRRRWTHWDTEG